jgi:hypothetical protein
MMNRIHIQEENLEFLALPLLKSLRDESERKAARRYRRNCIICFIIGIMIGMAAA